MVVRAGRPSRGVAARGRIPQGNPNSRDFPEYRAKAWVDDRLPVDSVKAVVLNAGGRRGFITRLSVIVKGLTKSSELLGIN